MPADRHWANPGEELGAFAIVTTLDKDELQWLLSVRSWVLPSLNVPIAVNCWVPPAATVGDAGVTASETSVPVPTVSVVVPFIPDAEAVIVTVPLFFPSARPKPRMDTMLGFDDFQDTPLRFVATLPSLNVPVAVNLTEVPFVILALAGLMVIETR